MTTRTFAPWVEPVAAVLADGRRQVLEFARQAPGGLWGRSTEAEGWTCKDVLCHLAVGNDRFLQTVLRAVTAGEALDPALLKLDTDTENKRGVEARRDWPVEQLLSELEKDGEHVQELLSRLTDGQRELRQDGFPMSLGEFLKLVEEEKHDLLHLAQIRKAMEGAS